MNLRRAISDGDGGRLDGVGEEERVQPLHRGEDGEGVHPGHHTAGWRRTSVITKKGLCGNHSERKGERYKSSYSKGHQYADMQRLVQ